MGTYFAREIGKPQGSVKIGHSIMTRCRVGNISAQVKKRLEVVAEAHWGYEPQFHELLMDWHEGGEWFSPSPLLDRVIGELNAGTFDFASLPKGRRITGVRHCPTHIGKFATPEAA
jgi:hypothetical protein